MAVVPDPHHGHALLGGDPDSLLGGIPGHDVAGGPLGVDQPDGGLEALDPECRLEIHAAGPDALGVVFHPHDAVGIHAPQIGIDKHIGHDDRVLLRHARLAEPFHNQLLQDIFFTDYHSVSHVFSG